MELINPKADKKRQAEALAEGITTSIETVIPGHLGYFFVLFPFEDADYAIGRATLGVNREYLSQILVQMGAVIADETPAEEETPKEDETTKGESNG